jgi:long-chain acyl-CoA synthetase
MDRKDDTKLKPSEQNIHLQYYEKEARERSQVIADDITITDLIKETACGVYSELPALIYHLNNMVTTVPRSKFIENIDTYAKALDSLGVKEGECVPLYGPFVPEMGYIILALIQIGAWANILMLNTSKEDMEKQTSESKVAVVFDGIGLYNNIRDTVEHERFEKVLVVSPSDSFGFLQRNITDIYSNHIAKKLQAIIPNTKKYIRHDGVLRLAREYSVAPKAASITNRIAVGTGTSGTTGGAKCAVVTNEALISNIMQTKFAVATHDIYTTSIIQDGFSYSGYRAGQRFLSQWPFISTSLSSLFLLPLVNGMTLICDPMAAAKTENYYSSIFKFCPNQVISTGPETRRFFRLLKKSNEKRPLDFLIRYIIGGEGITNEDYYEYLDLLHKHGVKEPENVLSLGYGLSECFAAVTSKLSGMQIPKDEKIRLVPSVGIPFPATSIGVFDSHGNELDYGKRGEIRVNADISKTVMDKYYLCEELTDKVLVKDKNGVTWFHTNDIGEIGQDGQLFYYCRVDDFLETLNGTDIYSADIANYIIHNDKTLEALADNKGCELSFDEDVRYCFISKFNLVENKYVIAAHIVIKDKKADLNRILAKINKKLAKYFPANLIPVGYKVYEDFLPEALAWNKTDRKLLSSYLNGYFQPSDNGLIPVRFYQDEISGLFSVDYSQ